MLLSSSSSSSTSSSSSSWNRMYGDGINGVIFLVALPLLIYQAIYTHVDVKLQQIAPIVVPYTMYAPQCICTMFAITAVVQYRSWYSTNRIASIAALICMNIITLVLILLEWPNPGEERMTNHVLWQLVTITANQPHTLPTKCCMAFLTLLTATVVITISPRYHTNNNNITTTASTTGSLDNNCYFLLGASAVFITFNYGLSRSSLSTTITKGIIVQFVNVQDQPTVVPEEEARRQRKQWVRWGLIGACGAVVLIYIAIEMYTVSLHPADYWSTGARKIMGALFFGSTGLVVGNGGKHIHRLPSSRRQDNGVVDNDNRYTGANTTTTKTGRDHPASSSSLSSSIHIATVALNASPAPLAITDGRRHVLMSNVAFRQWTGHHASDGDVIQNVPLEEVFDLTDDDDALLRLLVCFEADGPAEDEFVIQDQYIQVQVTPRRMQHPSAHNSKYNEDDDDDSINNNAVYYVILLRDGSYDFELEQAVYIAKRNALEAQAIVAATNALSRAVVLYPPPPLNNHNNHRRTTTIDIIPNDDDDDDSD